jgi:hypothetical protein
LVVEESGFKSFLKKKGKKQQVIDDLVSSVNYYREFLLKICGKTIENSTGDDLLKFSQIHENDRGLLKKRLRGIALYYSFISKGELAILASDLREEEISKTRKVFKLEDFKGVDPEDIEKLSIIGIRDAGQMIDAAKTPELREKLSRKTGIEMERILEYVKLSDLSRMPGMKGIRARLYCDAGVDTVEKLASWDPQELREMLIKFVEETGFDGIAPLPKEVRNTVESARVIERIVVY